MNSPPPPSSSVNRLWTPALLALALVAPACQDDPLPGQSPDELQALLDDAELDLPAAPAVSALSSEAAPPPKVPPPPSGAGGDGGASGAGGRAGAGGVIDGGVGPDPTGAGGRIVDGGFDGDFPVFCPGERFPRPPGSVCPLTATGKWDFDFCNTFRTDLADDSFNGFTAFRSVNTACVPGVEGQGISLPNKGDIVYVPDQPVFTFERGVTVAAWLKPSELGGVRTIFRKRDGLTSALALMLVHKHYVFVVGRDKAFPAAVTAPAKAGVFTHVAATYDGEHLRIYLDGKEAGVTAARGLIEAGEGPLLFGNDGLRRRFEGTFDKVWFATQAADADTIRSLQCLRGPASLKAIPEASDPVPPGTAVTFELALTSNSHPACGLETFQVSNDSFAPGFVVDPGFQSVQVAAGETTRVPVTVTSSEDSEPGPTPISFVAFDDMKPFDGELPRARFIYNVAEGTGCRVSTRKELMIRDVSVVDDPVRTDPGNGAWSFKHLMEQLAPSPDQASALTEAVFRSFTVPQTINGFRVEPRPGMQGQILDQWPRDAEGRLDLAAAPVRLLAIVNRVDLRFLDKGDAGEGRFIFGLLGPGGRSLEATVIFEYLLPASTEDEVLAWANAWHGLGSLPFPSEEYNAALQAVTDRFVARGAAPGRPNGSALNTFRTNEIDLGFNGVWELREFTLSVSGELAPDTVKLTPDRPGFDRTPLLASFINDNADAIRRERHDVPPSIRDGEGDRPFVAGAVFNDLSSWSAPGVLDAEARHKFALNTCNGCHSSQETNTRFLMVFPRQPGQEAPLSPFLTGTVTFDPFFGPRALNDLARRNRDLRRLICPEDERPPLDPVPQPTPIPDAGAPDGGGFTDARFPVPPPSIVVPGGPGPIPAPGASAAPASRSAVPFVEPDPPTTIRRGIGRVH